MSRFLTRQVCVLTVLALAPFAVAQPWSEGGYADRASVAQGGTITFHVSTSISPFAIQIVNLAQPTQVLATISGLTSTVIDCAGLWENGCGWPATTQFTIPSAWPSGYYAARFPTSGGVRNSIFIVRAANPGVASSILVVAPTNTWQAYNQFGGKSVYDSISTNGQRAHIVSMKRPYYDNLGLARYPAWEQHIVNWMTAENRAFDLISDDDLADPNLLGNYRLVLLVGHSEYWTLPARQNLEAYSRAGGNVAVFSGNTMWWQSRVNFETRQFTVYKAANLDPMTGVDDDVVTVNFFDWPVFNPENYILGASFRHGGYANVVAGSTEALPVEERTPFTVVDASDWAFNGTGLIDGGTFGKAAAGNEVDGAVFNTLPTGELLVDGSDGTPLNFKILATVPGQEGYGVIGYYVNENRGVLFNVSTRDWLRGLSVDAAVQQITRNVLDRLSLAEPLPYIPRTSPWLTEELFNTPSPLPGVLEGWRSDLREASVSAQCAQEGPFGLRLEGEDWTQLLRNFTPDNIALTSAKLTFEVNLDALTASPSFTMPVVELIDNQNDDITIYAAVEMAVRPLGKSIRLSLYNAAGTRTATTAWIVLSTGWHNVTVTWSSPGSGILEIDDDIRHELANPTAGQEVREIMLEFAGSGFGATGAICLDAMRLSDPNAPVQAATTTTVTSSLNPAHPGESVTFTATVTSATAGTITGNVTFSDGASVIGTATLTSGTASLTRSNLAPGSHAITARYDGDTNYAGSISSTLTQIITLLPPSTVDATTITQGKIGVSWSAVANAASYRVERSFDNGPFVVLATVATASIEDTAVSANKSYLYRVSTVDGDDNAGPPSTRDVATTKQFTADPQGLIRAAHINELRVTINAFRASAGLGAVTYSRPNIVAGMSVNFSDIIEMRTAVNAARTTLGLATFAFTEAIAHGSVIKWQHWRELQTAIAAIPAP
ncbi:MAG TPA: N,N-dimethylformamidase beta subunit family domain-containing protein [Thermoanaerobaculia bacterium]|nr:N,N-dimethylformamidase beta subunit family domain-containing protein [Thermoanaerobaculia bacterium]